MSEKKEGGLPPWLVVMMAALYVLSPIDFAPEALLGPLGLLDDGMVIWTALQALRKK